MSQAKILENPPAETSLPGGSEQGHKAPVLTRSLLTGAGALGMALGVERGGSFLSNVLAARLGGTATFGAYSIALTTANNIASYAGAGIGYTATRFIAEHAPGTKGYQRVARYLTWIAITSAAIALIALWLGAAPMARLLLRNEKLTGPLRVAALSSAAFVALECCRGVFLGTRKFGHLLVMSAMVGAGLLIAVPMAAKLGASRMIAGQAVAVLIAVAVSGFLILKPVKLRPTPALREAEVPSLGRVWRFGLVQLGGVVGLNAASWWTATLVARGDPSLFQVAFYAVATQLRNMTSLLPGLVSQGNFAFFTDEGSAEHGGAGSVVAVSTILSSVLATVCAFVVVVLLPFILRFYGKSYIQAEIPAVLAVATVLIHIGNAPAASRLTVVSLRWTGIINAIWAVFVIAMGTALIRDRGATAATATLFSAHLLSVILVLGVLWWLRSLPTGVISVTTLNVAAALAFSGLSWLRTIHSNYTLELNALMFAVTAGVSVTLLRLAQHRGVLPRPFEFARVLRWKS